MKRAVAILGCGPAGLFAAQAAVDLGYPVEIFSASVEPSRMFGAQYLHSPVPHLSHGSFTIDYILEGKVRGYAEKVYGPEIGPDMAGSVSPNTYLGLHYAWDIREAYSRAWDRFGSQVIKQEITAETLPEVVGKSRHTHVVSAIPAPALCLLGGAGGHEFASAQIWAQGDDPDRGLYCTIRTEHNTVVCNGESSPSWYRASNVQGWRNVEWPTWRARPPYEGVVKVGKPLSTKCDCWLPRPGREKSFSLGIPFWRVGRYGTWTKGVLSHSAYYATENGLS